MELGTFGAIISYAMELEKQASRLYGQPARTAFCPAFEGLSRAAPERLKRLERARRELVAEMILESITGLDGETYRVLLDPLADDKVLLQQAQAFEDAAQRFYQDAAAKMPIREVVRLFQRLAREHDESKAALARCACGL